MGGNVPERRVPSDVSYSHVASKLKAKTKTKTTKEFCLADLQMILEETGLVEKGAVLQFEEAERHGPKNESYTETVLRATWEG